MMYVSVSIAVEPIECGHQCDERDLRQGSVLARRRPNHNTAPVRLPCPYFFICFWSGYAIGGGQIVQIKDLGVSHVHGLVRRRWWGKVSWRYSPRNPVFDTVSLDMLATEVLGRGEIYAFVRQLLATRYHALAHHFPVGSK